MRPLNPTFLPALVLFFATSQAAAQGGTQANEAAAHGAAASGHASASAAHSVAASGQLTSAALAVPLLSGGAVLGSAGAVSAGAGRDSLRAATAPIGTPLEITDEVITIIPPNEALKPKTKEVKL